LAHLGGDVVEVGGRPANDRAEGDHRLVAPGGRRPRTHQRDLEGPGRPDQIEARVDVDAVAAQGVFAAGDEPAGDELVESASDDGESTARINEMAFDGACHGNSKSWGAMISRSTGGGNPTPRVAWTSGEGDAL